jgi:hypothetical protein
MLDIQSENDSDYEATILIQELFVNSRENLSWGESNLIFQKLEKDNIFKERSLLNSAQNLIEISNKLELSESHWRARNALSLNRNMIQLILSPLSILGTILFWPISSFTENFVSKKVKDPLFKNSIRIAFKTFLGAPYAALIATLFSLLLPVNWLISLFSILMLGVLSVRAKIYLRMFISAIKLKRVLNQNSPQSQAYIIQRNNLISQINLLIHEKSK